MGAKKQQPDRVGRRARLGVFAFASKQARNEIDQVFTFTDLIQADIDLGDGKLFRRHVKLWDAHKALPMSQLLIEPDDAADLAVIKRLCRLRITYQFDTSWVDAYLGARKGDLKPFQFRTIEESLSYIHGVSETISMMIAKIIGLPKSCMHAAAMQGRVVYLIGTLSRLDESMRFVPLNELRRHGLNAPSLPEIDNKPEEFKSFISSQLKLYNSWQRQANKVIQKVPKRNRRSIILLIELYRYSAFALERDPMTAFSGKARPSRRVVIQSALTHLFD